MARDWEIQVALTHKKQTAYGTKNVDGDLTIGALFQLPEPLAIDPEFIRDNSQFGRGHEWSEGQEIESWDLKGSLSFDLTSRIAGHYLAFGLGSIATVQPDAGGNPTVYDHTIKPQDALTSIQLPSMTQVWKYASGFKKKIWDLVADTVEIVGQPNKRLQISVGQIGSGNWEASTLSMPAIAAAKFLRMKDLKLEIGGFGGALTDFSSKVKEWRFKIGNNHMEKDGYYPGSGLYRGRCEFGDRVYELSFIVVVGADTQERDRLEAITNLAAKMTAEGETISGIYKHRLIVNATDIHYAAVPLGYVDKKLVYKITCNVNYDATGGIVTPVTCDVRNDVAAYLN